MTPQHPTGATEVDVCIIGGGQSGLVLGFHLRRLNRRPGTPQVSFVLLDDRLVAGGAWGDGWDTLTLFSPAGYSSLAGWPMPAWPGPGNPSARHVADYLAAYEARYDLPVVRPRRVTSVTEAPDGSGRLDVITSQGPRWSARTVVNTTGTWGRPFWPALAGAESFTGTQLHASAYRSASTLPGAEVLVVGGGNSGAQIAADLLLYSTKAVTWCTRERPRFLPDEVDGRVLFEVATQAVNDRGHGVDHAGVGGLGDIVAVPSVRKARDEHGLRAEPMPVRLTADGAIWADGTARDIDTIVWCTGFRSALRHLHDLGLHADHGHPRTAPDTSTPGVSVAADDGRVFFLGYGDWCAPASATLIGVNRSARDTAQAVAAQVLDVEASSALRPAGAQSSRRG